MIIKIAGGKDKDGNVLWQHVYSDAIRNRLRRDQNLADIPDINEARKNLGIEHVSDDSLVSLNSDLHSYVLSEINSLRGELNSYRINHTDVNINALDSRLTALANKVTSLTMSEVDSRFNTLWDAAKKEIKNYILQLYDASDGTLPDFPSDFNTLHWCGVMSNYPTQPKAGWFVVIKNTEIDNLAYVYTGNQWVLLGCTASHDSSGGGGEQPSGGGGEQPSGGGGDSPSDSGDEQPDDDDVSTPDKPKDPFKPENEDQQYRYEYTFKLEPNHPALNVDAYTGTTKTNPRIYRLGLDTDGNARIFLPAAFSVSGNASAVSQKLYPPETVSSTQAQPTELGRHLVETRAEDDLVKLSITADSLVAIKEDWGVTSITGSLLVLVYDYTNSAQKSLDTEIPVKYVRFIPQESGNNTTQWALFQSTGSVKTVNIKVPANINANTSTQYWVNDYMPVIADSVMPAPETGCVYLQGLRLQYSNGNTSLLAIASRSTAPLCYLAAALWQTVETVDNTNPAPPSPEPGDHSANATDYDSSFPFLEDLITKVKGSFEGAGTVLLDFVLEKEDSSLRFGKKPFTREYKTRNHYISGHFAMHGHNAVLYLPEDYFDDRYLKGFYCRANYIKYQDSDSKWQEENITNDVSNLTELIPFNVNLEHTIINLERTYDEMPPDIGYGVIKIPEETLERICKEDNVDSMWSRSVLNLQRDFHLLLEYDFGSNSANNTDTSYTEIKFTSLAFSEPGDYWNSYAQMYTTNNNNDKQNFIRYNSVTNIANDLKFKLPYWFKTEDKTALGSEPISCIFKNEYTLGLVYEKTETDVLLSQDFYKVNNMTVWATGNQRAYNSQPNLPASFFCVDYQYAKDNSCIYSLTYPKTQLTYYKKAKPDHYDNASNYDSAFPYLTDLISMIKSKSDEQTNIESVNKWLLDFKLEAEDEDLKMGRKAYTVEYKQRNHYVSGHFAMHGNNAVLYLPSDYFDSAYLKNVYIASEDETYCTIYAASSYESRERTIFGTKNQLYPLNVKLSDNVPALVMDKTYADMPPDTDYGVILIPAETMSRIRVSTHYPDDTVESLPLVDTLKLVLEYDFNNAITGTSDNKKVGCVNFRLLQNSSFSELTSNKKAGLKPYFTQQENNVSDDYVTIDRFMDTVQVMFSYLSPSYYDFVQFVAVSKEYTAASLYRFELMMSSLRKESSHTPLSYEHYTSDTYAISSVQFVTLDNKRFKVGNDAVSNYGFIFSYKYPKDNIFVVITTVQEDSVNVWGQPKEPDTPSKPDYSDNASYDSSFPDLSSILNNGLSKKKWLLDFPLENHSDNLLKGKKSFIREYKQRNHYISGHFVKHNGNAVIYLPEDYLNSSLLKAVYLAPPPNQHLTVCTEGNFELDAQRTKTFKDNQLVPLDSNEYPLLVSNRSYTDMPPDTGYGVIVIPKSTLHCIQCDWNGTIDDTGLDEYDGLHLVLEYQLNITPAGASAGGTYGYMRFLPANNAASADADIKFAGGGSIGSENYWLLPDNATQSNTIITIPELPANTIAHYHNFIYRYEYTFNPGIYISGSGTASDSGTVLTYNGNLAIQGDIHFAKSSNITYWTGNTRAGNPNNISGKLKPYFELQYPTDNVIIFITTIDLAR